MSGEVWRQIQSSQENGDCPAMATFLETERNGSETENDFMDIFTYTLSSDKYWTYSARSSQAADSHVP